MRDVVPEKDLVLLCKGHEKFLTKARQAALGETPDHALFFLQKAQQMALKCFPKAEVLRRTQSGFYGKALAYEGEQISS